MSYLLFDKLNSNFLSKPLLSNCYKLQASNWESYVNRKQLDISYTYTVQKVLHDLSSKLLEAFVTSNRKNEGESRARSSRTDGVRSPTMESSKIPGNIEFPSTSTRLNPLSW